jgi:hypothetical protein
MQQQMMLSQQQAMGQITMATLAKCISLITRADTTNPDESKEVTTAAGAMNKLFET